MHSPPRFPDSLRRWTPALLFALNLSVAWRLLNTQYTSHWDSIEPFFYAIAAHIREHPFDSGWWPNWNCGMPFRYTYQPMLHYLVALVSAITNLSAARSFHFTLGIFYAAGPVTFFYMVRRLSSKYSTAAFAALFYSLCSPSTWLMPDVAADIDGILHARRLHTAVVYGDGPHVAGLTLVPLALLLIDRARERRTVPRIFLAALGSIAVLLVNVPAALVLAMAVLAYCLAGSRNDWVSRIAIPAIAALWGYLLIAPMIPPSGQALAARNTQWMDEAGQMTPLKAAAIVCAILTLAGLSWGLSKLRAGWFTRFALAFSLITITIVMSKPWWHISVLAQPTRFHLAMEMAIAMLIAIPVTAVPIRNRWSAVLAVVVVTAAAGWQFGEYRLYARKIVKREIVEDRSEGKIAKWMDHNAGGARVMVPGSVGFWFAALTSTPQIGGCCDQNYLFQTPRLANYIIGSDDGAGQRAGEISIIWLKTLGVKFIAVSGPQSSETYHVIHHPHKFDGLLPKRWQDGDDAIFEVPGMSGSLAHWIARSESVASMPINGVEVAPLLSYVQAVADASRPQASFAWRDTMHAAIAGSPRAGDLLSVQIPFHSGWRASDDSGKSIPVGQDALGFLLLDPHCHGNCSVRLTFDGGRESTVLQALCAGMWLITAISLARSFPWWKNRNGRRTPEHAEH